MGVWVSIAILKAPSKNSLNGSLVSLNVPSGNIKIEMPFAMAAFKARTLLALFSRLLLSTSITATYKSNQIQALSPFRICPELLKVGELKVLLVEYPSMKYDWLQKYIAWLYYVELRKFLCAKCQL